MSRLDGSCCPASSAAAAPKKAPTSPTPSTPMSTSTSRSMTPIIPAIESLKGELDSRPQTPTVIGLDKDEREDFLKRESELSDSLAEKENALNTAEKLVKELKDADPRYVDPHTPVLSVD